MNLTALPKIVKRGKKRLGRGYGSGKAKTSGRGTKGLKARNDVPIQFEGAAAGASFYKRLPLLRGKGKFKASTNKPVGINVKYLNVLRKDTVVTIETLISNKIVDKKATTNGVKILGDGELTISLTVMLPVTGGAKKKIEKAGGTVGEEAPNKPAKQSTEKTAKAVKSAKPVVKKSPSKVVKPKTKAKKK